MTQNRLRLIEVTGKDGLKGQWFRTALTGFDLFTGPNGSGKSTRLLAVQAAARGLAVSTADTMREYLGPKLPQAEVALTFDRGGFARDLSTTRGKATTKSDLQADALMGEHLARWDLADFAKGTDTERAKVIERVCNAAAAGGAWTPARAETELRKSMKIDAADELGELHPLRECLALWSKDAPVGTWLARAIEKNAELFTTLNRAQKDATAQAQDTAPEDPLTGNLTQKREELARILSEGEAVGVKLASAAPAAQRARDLLADTELAAVEALAADTAYTEAEEKAQNARRRVRECPMPAAFDDRIERERVTAAAAYRVLAEAGAQARAAVDRRNEATQEWVAAESTVAALTALAEGATGACRHCEGLDPLNMEARLAAAREALEAGTAARGGAAFVSGRRDRALQLAQETAERATEEEALVVEEKRAAARALDTATLSAAEAETALATATERRNRAAEVVRTLAERQARAEPPSGDLVALNATRDALLIEHKRVKAEVEQHIRHEEREIARLAAVAERAAAVLRFELVKALAVALKHVQALVAEDAYAPIEQAANALLRDARITMVILFRDPGDFGAAVLQRDGTDPYVTYWSLSDAEKALFAAALAVALATLTKSPWPAVIIDGLEKIDAEHRGGFLSAVHARVERGELANFIGAIVSTTAPVAEVRWPGATVHWLGA